MPKVKGFRHPTPFTINYNLEKQIATIVFDYGPSYTFEPTPPQSPEIREEPEILDLTDDRAESNFSSLETETSTNGIGKNRINRKMTFGRRLALLMEGFDPDEIEYEEAQLSSEDRDELALEQGTLLEDEERFYNYLNETNFVGNLEEFCNCDQ